MVSKKMKRTRQIEKANWKKVWADFGKTEHRIMVE